MRAESKLINNVTFPPSRSSSFARNSDDAYVYKVFALALGALIILVILQLVGDGEIGRYVRAYFGRGLAFGILAVLGWIAFYFGLRLIALNTRVWSWLTKGILLDGVLIALAIGFTANLVLTLAGAWAFDSEIKKKFSEAIGLTRFVEIRYPGVPPIFVRPLPDEGYEVTEPLGAEVPETFYLLLTATEDANFDTRVTGDIGRIAGAAWSLIYRGKLQGASGLDAQLAGLLFDFRTGGNLWLKLRKSLIALRLDDLYSRATLRRAYVAVAPAGTLRGHDVRGLALAARIYYGRHYRELSLAQQAELVARLKGQSVYFPYPQPNERPEVFKNRLQRHRERVAWVLRRAEQTGAITPAQRAQATTEIFAGLQAPSEALMTVTRPRLRAVISEVAHLIPGRGSRRLSVEVHFEAAAQAALELAVRRAVKEISPGLPTYHHADDRVVTDVVVINGAGAIVASLGAIVLPTSPASVSKIEVYGIAVERGVLPNMRSSVDGRDGVTAEDALLASINEAAMQLDQRIGVDIVAADFRRLGFQVTGPFQALAIGSGLAASPLQVARMASKYGYDHPGCEVTPGLVAEVRDAETGELLYHPPMTRVFGERTALEVRRVMEKNSVVGTGKRLAAFTRPVGQTGEDSTPAGKSPVASKTGTSAFFDGRWHNGDGSWIAVIDSVSHLTVVVRMRWQSGLPFEPNGGDSACLVARNFLQQIRAIRNRHK